MGSVKVLRHDVRGSELMHACSRPPARFLLRELLGTGQRTQAWVCDAKDMGGGGGGGGMSRDGAGARPPLTSLTLWSRQQDGSMAWQEKYSELSKVFQVSTGRR